MIRIFSYAAGAVLTFILLISLYGTVSDYFSAPAEETAEHEFHREAKELHLASDGPFGHFDRAQLQRGLQVYTEVCAACHGINLVSFRDLQALGYNEARSRRSRLRQFLEDRSPVDQPRHRRGGDPQGHPGRPLPEPLRQ